MPRVDNPEMPCPDVQPPANLAPNISATPPEKARMGGMIGSPVSYEATPSALKATAPANTPPTKDNGDDLGGFSPLTP